MSEDNTAQTPANVAPAEAQPVKPKKRFVSRIGLLRLVVFFFLLALTYALPQIGLQKLLPVIPKALVDWVVLATAAFSGALCIGVYVLLARGMERRHTPELGLKKGAPQLVLGIILAILMFALIYVAMFGLKAATWQGFGSTQFVVRMAAMALISGICEEMIFRGGVYRITEDMFGSGVALLISGLFFGLVHLGNPGATLFSSIAIAVEAGILLGAAYAATRNLWLPIGIHIGWNFAEGGIFGAAVSGGKAGRGLFNIPLHGPDWLTGGAFGPEASVVTLGICTAAGLYFVWRTIKTGRWCRAGFRMMLD